jgi:hypothetical protein
MTYIKECPECQRRAVNELKTDSCQDCGSLMETIGIEWEGWDYDGSDQVSRR